MAIIENKYKVIIKNIGAGNLLSNSGFISMFEEAGCVHSDIAGYGVNQMNSTNVSWVLLHWKVKIFKRPIYNETVNIKTWSRNSNKVVTYRDFEMYDKNGNLLAIATTKWTLVSTDSGSITKITPEIIDRYTPEDSSNVFGEIDIPKLKEPIELEQNMGNISPNYTFTVQRRDIDMNRHMHNLYYLDYALEALPQEIYENLNCNEFEIMYKNGAKLGNNINCFYYEQDDSYYVIMKSAENNKLHAIIKLVK